MPGSAGSFWNLCPAAVRSSGCSRSGPAENGATNAPLPRDLDGTVPRICGQRAESIRAGAARGCIHGARGNSAGNGAAASATSAAIATACAAAATAAWHAAATGESGRQEQAESENNETFHAGHPFEVSGRPVRTPTDAGQPPGGKGRVRYRIRRFDARAISPLIVTSRRVL
jgi:hypothetical protein